MRTGFASIDVCGHRERYQGVMQAVEILFFNAETSAFVRVPRTSADKLRPQRNAECFSCNNAAKFTSAILGDLCVFALRTLISSFPTTC